MISALGIEHIVGVETKRLPSEQVSNDSNLVILTLRNLVSVLLGKADENKKATDKLSPVSASAKSSLKVGLIAIAGLAALLIGEDVLASQSPEHAASDTPPNPSTGTGTGVNTNTVDTKFDNLDTGTDLGKGPASSPPLVPRKAPVNTETMLSKGGDGSVDSAIQRAASATGEKVEDLRAIIHLESKGDPRAKSTQFYGLGQLGRDAWADVQKAGGLKLPPLTGDANDPRYDPYLNALATAAYMSLNRKRVAKAAKAAGYPGVTLGLLYGAHNLGAGTINKMLADGNSNNWDDQTKGYVANQAKELTKDGLGSYLSNADAAMKAHYATANTGVGAKQVASAEGLGVMSSTKPQQLANRTAQPVTVASAEKVPSKSTNVKISAPSSTATNGSSGGSTERVATNSPQGAGSRSNKAQGSDEPTKFDEPFRLKNGQMAAV